MVRVLRIQELTNCLSRNSYWTVRRSPLWRSFLALHVTKRRLSASAAVSWQASTSMLIDETSLLPLGRALESHFGLPTQECLSYEARGIYNWHRAVLLTTGGSGDRGVSSAGSKLSTAQAKSFMLLWEWQTGYYQGQGSRARTIRSFSDDYPGGEERLVGDIYEWARSTQPSSGLEYDTDAYQRLSSPQIDNCITQTTGPAADTYDRLAWELFHLEFFHSDNYETIGHLKGLIQVLTERRQRLCGAAHVHYTALGVCNELLDLRFCPSAAEGNPTIETCGSQSDAEDFWFPYAADEPVFQSCAWIPTAPKSSENLPHFLWDRHKQKTVRMSDLESVPAYTAISHTWGRWTADPTTYSEISGVPWPVPRNSLYKVERLPNIFHQIPIETHYLWFDLFCIPQNGGVLKEQEIAKQAQVFRHAEDAVAWINEGVDIEALSTAVSLLCLCLAKFPEGSNCELQRLQMINSLSSALVDRSAGLLLGELPEGRGPLRSPLKPNNWSTSLWTLQEACLRPDMRIVNQDFAALRAAHGYNISVSSLANLWSSFAGTPQTTRDSIRVEPNRFSIVDEVALWLHTTSLFELKHISRLDILALGDRRFCKERRADAIMSAIGVSEWKTSGSKLASQMVLDKYPLSFIREVCAIDPGEFFGRYIKLYPRTSGLPPPAQWGGSTDDNDVRVDALRELDDLFGIRAEQKGSMLPFSRGEAVHMHLDIKFTGMASLSYVATWNIMGCGSVKVDHACIISSHFIARANRDQTGPEARSTVSAAVFFGNEIVNKKSSALAPLSRAASSPVDWIDLHMFMYNLNRPAYAVVVQQIPGGDQLWNNENDDNEEALVVSGLILQEKCAQRPGGTLDSSALGQDGPLQLVKIGLFTAVVERPSQAFFDPVKVDWIVI